jgi:hypothetical protein
MIPPIDETAVVAAWMSPDANLRPVVSVPRYSLGLGVARSGRESRFADRTGKLNFGGCRPDDGVALRIEGDDASRCPVAGLSAPAPRVALACILVDPVARGAHGTILPGMTLRRGGVADTAVVRLMVVPVHEAGTPFSGRLAVGKPLERELGTIYFAVRNSASATGRVVARRSSGLLCKKTPSATNNQRREIRPWHNIGWAPGPSRQLRRTALRSITFLLTHFPQPIFTDRCCLLRHRLRPA